MHRRLAALLLPSTEVLRDRPTHVAVVGCGPEELLGSGTCDNSLPDERG